MSGGRQGSLTGCYKDRRREERMNVILLITLSKISIEMINYSTYMKANPTDESAPLKAYARVQMTELMTFDKFVKHIADHNGVYTRGTVKGVVSDMCECLVEMLLSGRKVMLGDLGDFWISISSVGADSLQEFTAQNIKEVNIVFTPGEDFQNLAGRATFNLVSSRLAQQATLKAEKSGQTTVDLEAAKNKKPSGGSQGGSTTTDPDDNQEGNPLL